MKIENTHAQQVATPPPQHQVQKPPQEAPRQEAPPPAHLGKKVDTTA